MIKILGNIFMSETINPKKYLDMMKDIQEKILAFLEDECNCEENFQNLEKIINDTKIRDNQNYFLSLLHLILQIGNNHYRNTNFFDKIERILQNYIIDIKKYFSNYQIFNIFKSNKRILLFLIEQQIIKFDESIAKKITTTDKYIKFCYPQYFQPEIQPFINKKWFPKYNPLFYENNWIEEIEKELPENFYEKRKKGENDSQICELIRNCMITKFIAFITKNNIQLNATIPVSIYETNSYLLKKQFYYNKEEEFTLIEYATFCGSIQLFKYLKSENIEIKPSLLPLAIHGQNTEIINMLEDENVKLNTESYKNGFFESIKCHHNYIAKYFLNNFLTKYEINQQNIINQSLKYYNFDFLKNEHINKSSFFKLCKYDYGTLVEYILKSKDIDINRYI